MSKKTIELAFTVDRTAGFCNGKKASSTADLASILRVLPAACPVGKNHKIHRRASAGNPDSRAKDGQAIRALLHCARLLWGCVAGAREEHPGEKSWH
jgi:hypothetical protein